MHCLSLEQFGVLEGIVIGVLSILTTFGYPEIRRVFKLDPPLLKPAFAGKVFWSIWISLLALALALLCWFLVCRAEAQPRPAPVPVPSPTPTAKGPVNIYPPVTALGAEFTLYVFTPEYHWSYGKVEVEFNGKTKLAKEMVEYISNLSGTMVNADAIICVGTASKDVKKDEQYEEGRAFTRAEQLLIWTRPAISLTGRDIEVFRLNLGHYREPPDRDDQRLIILVSVKKIDPTRSIDDILSPENSGALLQELKKEGFPFLFEAYSLFDLQKKS